MPENYNPCIIILRLLWRWNRSWNSSLLPQNESWLL